MSATDLYQLNEIFTNKFTDKGNIRYFRAPGRVNLIGGHTDYNDGFVLPVAINKEMLLAARKREDNLIKVYSSNFEDLKSFNLDEINFNSEVMWINYIQGVAKFLQEAGYNLGGLDIVISGTVPQGAGLSSSAALEVVIARAFSNIFDLELDKVEMARIAQKAEKHFVGVNCGIMDQFISSMGRENMALFIDCRSWDYDLTPIKGDSFKIVVANTKVEHELANSEYNKRIEECLKAVELLNELLPGDINKLRDVNLEDFNSVKERLPEIIQKRAEHVIMENRRVKACKQALQDNDLEQAGRLITSSHNSLSNLYKVSCEELDIMVEAALNIEGILGARMTGAGFGGSTINLVEDQAVPEFINSLKKKYKSKTGISPDIYECEIVNGSNEIYI